MAKILVTGGAGFIGSHIVDRYIALGHEVLVVDNLITGQRENVNPRARFFRLDICDPDCAMLIRLEQPEIINHHAAQTMVRISTEQPAYDAQVNVLGFINLLQAAVKAGVRKVIFASSGGTVYGTSDRLPLTEDQPFAPESPYGISKVASEFYLRYYAAVHGLRYTALRYANIIGPRDTVSSEHVITVFIHRLLAGRPPIIQWDGEQAKDYLYVDDVVEANVLALERGDNAAYNIGSGRPVSVNEIYRLLTEITGIHIPAEHGPKRPGDVRLFYLDCSKAARELGWRPAVPFEEAVARTVAWHRARAEAQAGLAELAANARR
ncbi:MAG: NAD-dependent epimerase/dehydratase family protein [Anaerolineae bacterium]